MIKGEKRENNSAEMLATLQGYIDRAVKIKSIYQQYEGMKDFIQRINDLENFIKIAKTVLGNAENLRDFTTIPRLIIRAKQLGLDAD